MDRGPHAEYGDTNTTMTDQHTKNMSSTKNTNNTNTNTKTNTAGAGPANTSTSLRAQAVAGTYQDSIHANTATKNSVTTPSQHLQTPIRRHRNRNSISNNNYNNNNGGDDDDENEESDDRIIDGVDAPLAPPSTPNNTDNLDYRAGSIQAGIPLKNQGSQGEKEKGRGREGEREKEEQQESEVPGAGRKEAVESGLGKNVVTTYTTPNNTLQRIKEWLPWRKTSGRQQQQQQHHQQKEEKEEEQGNNRITTMDPTEGAAAAAVPPEQPQADQQQPPQRPEDQQHPSPPLQKKGMDMMQVEQSVQQRENTGGLGETPRVPGEKSKHDEKSQIVVGTPESSARPRRVVRANPRYAYGTRSASRGESRNEHHTDIEGINKPSLRQQQQQEEQQGDEQQNSDSQNTQDAMVTSTSPNVQDAARHLSQYHQTQHVSEAGNRNTADAAGDNNTSVAGAIQSNGNHRNVVDYAKHDDATFSMVARNNEAALGGTTRSMAADTTAGKLKVESSVPGRRLRSGGARKSSVDKDLTDSHHQNMSIDEEEGEAVDQKSFAPGNEATVVESGRQFPQAQQQAQQQQPHISGSDNSNHPIGTPTNTTIEGAVMIHDGDVEREVHLNDLTSEDVDALTYRQLQGIARYLGLPANGKLSVLKSRIKEVIRDRRHFRGEETQLVYLPHDSTRKEDENDDENEDAEADARKRNVLTGKAIEAAKSIAKPSPAPPGGLDPDLAAALRDMVAKKGASALLQGIQQIVSETEPLASLEAPVIAADTDGDGVLNELREKSTLAAKLSRTNSQSSIIPQADAQAKGLTLVAKKKDQLLNGDSREQTQNPVEDGTTRENIADDEVPSPTFASYEAGFSSVGDMAGNIGSTVPYRFTTATMSQNVLVGGLAGVHHPVQAGTSNVENVANLSSGKLIGLGAPDVIVDSSDAGKRMSEPDKLVPISSNPRSETNQVGVRMIDTGVAANFGMSHTLRPNPTLSASADFVKSPETLAGPADTAAATSGVKKLVSPPSGINLFRKPPSKRPRTEEVQGIRRTMVNAADAVTNDAANIAEVKEPVMHIGSTTIVAEPKTSVGPGLTHLKSHSVASAPEDVATSKDGAALNSSVLKEGLKEAGDAAAIDDAVEEQGVDSNAEAGVGYVVNSGKRRKMTITTSTTATPEKKYAQQAHNSQPFVADGMQPLQLERPAQNGKGPYSEPIAPSSQAKPSPLASTPSDIIRTLIGKTSSQMNASGTESDSIHSRQTDPGRDNRPLPGTAFGIFAMPSSVGFVNGSQSRRIALEGSGNTDSAGSIFRSLWRSRRRSQRLSVAPSTPFGATRRRMNASGLGLGNSEIDTVFGHRSHQFGPGSSGFGGIQPPVHPHGNTVGPTSADATQRILDTLRRIQTPNMFTPAAHGLAAQSERKAPHWSSRRGELGVNGVEKRIEFSVPRKSEQFSGFKRGRLSDEQDNMDEQQSGRESVGASTLKRARPEVIPNRKLSLIAGPVPTASRLPMASPAPPSKGKDEPHHVGGGESRLQRLRRNALSKLTRRPLMESDFSKFVSPQVSDKAKEAEQDLPAASQSNGSDPKTVLNQGMYLFSSQEKVAESVKGGFGLGASTATAQPPVPASLFKLGTETQTAPPASTSSAFGNQPISLPVFSASASGPTTNKKDHSSLQGSANHTVGSFGVSAKDQSAEMIVGVAEKAPSMEPLRKAESVLGTAKLSEKATRARSDDDERGGEGMVTKRTRKEVPKPDSIGGVIWDASQGATDSSSAAAFTPQKGNLPPFNNGSGQSSALKDNFLKSSSDAPNDMVPSGQGTGDTPIWGSSSPPVTTGLFGKTKPPTSPKLPSENKVKDAEQVSVTASRPPVGTVPFGSASLTSFGAAGAFEKRIVQDGKAESGDTGSAAISLPVRPLGFAAHENYTPSSGESRPDVSEVGTLPFSTGVGAEKLKVEFGASSPDTGFKLGSSAFGSQPEVGKIQATTAPSVGFTFGSSAPPVAPVVAFGSAPTPGINLPKPTGEFGKDAIGASPAATAAVTSIFGKKRTSDDIDNQQIAGAKGSLPEDVKSGFSLPQATPGGGSAFGVGSAPTGSPFGHSASAKEAAKDKVGSDSLDAMATSPFGSATKPGVSEGPSKPDSSTPQPAFAFGGSSSSSPGAPFAFGSTSNKENAAATGTATLPSFGGTFPTALGASQAANTASAGFGTLSQTTPAPSFAFGSASASPFGTSSTAASSSASASLFTFGASSSSAPSASAPVASPFGVATPFGSTEKAGGTSAAPGAGGLFVFGSSSSAAASTSAPAAGGFGKPAGAASAAASVFGAPASSGGYPSLASSPAGSSASLAFGAVGNSVAGAPSASPFGAPPSGTSASFGSSALGGFGNASSAMGSGFGGSQSAGFAGANSMGSTFGKPADPAGNAQSAPFVFAPQNTVGGFGPKPVNSAVFGASAATGFGAASTSPFGAPTAAAVTSPADITPTFGSGFGAPAPIFGGFGAPAGPDQGSIAPLGGAAPFALGAPPGVDGGTGFFNMGSSNAPQGAASGQRKFVRARRRGGR